MGHQPRRTRVDHAMTVRAQQRQIAQLSSAGAADMQWDDVVTLDVAIPAVAVDLCEVKAAYLASYRPASLLWSVPALMDTRLDCQLTELPIS